MTSLIHFRYHCGTLYINGKWHIYDLESYIYIYICIKDKTAYMHVESCIYITEILYLYIYIDIYKNILVIYKLCKVVRL